MTKVRGTLRRDQRAEIFFHLYRVFGFCQSQPSGDPDKVGIRHDCRLAVDIAENQVCSFASHAGQGKQIFHIVRHHAAEVQQQLGRHFLDALGFHMIEAAGTDDLFQIADVCRRQ